MEIKLQGVHSQRKCFQRVKFIQVGLEDKVHPLKHPGLDQVIFGTEGLLRRSSDDLDAAAELVCGIPHADGTGAHGGGYPVVSAGVSRTAVGAKAGQCIILSHKSNGQAGAWSILSHKSSGELYCGVRHRKTILFQYLSQICGRLNLLPAHFRMPKNIV